MRKRSASRSSTSWTWSGRVASSDPTILFDRQTPSRVCKERFAILDTSVYVDHWRGDLEIEWLHEEFIVRHSAIVLSELRRGTQSTRDLRRLNELVSAAHVQWAPTAADWWHAAVLICTIGSRRDWDSVRRVHVQNDALIALTARRYGALLVARDRRDFASLSTSLPLSVLWL